MTSNWLFPAKPKGPDLAILSADNQTDIELASSPDDAFQRAPAVQFCNDVVDFIYQKPERTERPLPIPSLLPPFRNFPLHQTESFCDTGIVIATAHHAIARIVPSDAIYVADQDATGLRGHVTRQRVEDGCLATTGMSNKQYVRFSVFQRG